MLNFFSFKLEIIKFRSLSEIIVNVDDIAFDCGYACMIQGEAKVTEPIYSKFGGFGCNTFFIVKMATLNYFRERDKFSMLCDSFFR